MTMMRKGYLRHRGGDAWESTISVGGKQRSATFHGKQAAAEKWHRQRLVKFEDAAPSSPSKKTVGQWFDEWLGAIEADISPATHAHYEQAVRVHLKPRLGSIKLASLSELDVQRLRNDLALANRADGRPGKLALSTRRQIERVLKVALADAVEFKQIERNPAEARRRRRGSKVNQEPVTEMTTLSAEQSTALLEAARGTGLFAPILLALSTGCRRGEAAALIWADIDFDRSEVTFSKGAKQVRGQFIIAGTKTGRKRTITLGEAAIAELARWKLIQAEQFLLLGARPTKSTPVCTYRDGKRIGPNAISVDFWRFAKRLGLDVHYHLLRHSHATQLIERGHSIRLIADRLGHSDPSMTIKVYAHVTDDAQKKAAASIDEIFKSTASLRQD